MARKKLSSTSTKSSKSTESQNGEYLTYSDVIELTGVSVPGLSKWIADGHFPNRVRIGRNVLLSKTDLVALVNSGNSTKLSGFDVELIKNFKGTNAQDLSGKTGPVTQKVQKFTLTKGDSNSLTVQLDAKTSLALQMVSQAKGVSPMSFVESLVKKEVSPALKFMSKLK